MKTILVVDDEYDIALALELVFESVGYRVIKALDGREAIDLARQEKPDLVILDQMMPRLTGSEVIEILKSDPELSAVPLVLMSAAMIPSPDRPIAYSAFVRKPFTIDAVLNIVTALIGAPTT